MALEPLGAGHRSRQELVAYEEVGAFATQEAAAVQPEVDLRAQDPLDTAALDPLPDWAESGDDETNDGDGPCFGVYGPAVAWRVAGLSWEKIAKKLQRTPRALRTFRQKNP